MVLRGGVSGKITYMFDLNSWIDFNKVGTHLGINQKFHLTKRATHKKGVSFTTVCAQLSLSSDCFRGTYRTGCHTVEKQQQQQQQQRTTYVSIRAWRSCRPTLCPMPINLPFL
jgi:hypothetical protein